MTNSKALPLVEFYRKELGRRDDHFAKILAGVVGVEKFKEIVMTALLNTKDIEKCDQTEVLKAITRCAQSQLVPDGNEAAIVIRRSKHSFYSATFQPMVNGVIKTLHRSGQIKDITDRVVYTGEEFEYWIDGEKGVHLRHVPDFLGEKTERIPKNVRAVYAVVRTVNGGSYVEVLSKKDIDRARSFAKTDKFWGPQFEKMARKTAIHQVAKRLKLTPQMEVVQKAMSEEFDSIETTSSVVPEQKSLPTESKRIENLVESQEKPKKTMVI